MHFRNKTTIVRTLRMMNYLEFKNRMFDLVCFSTHQVYVWKPDFDRNNFVRWVKKGLLLRLRRGYYTFPEFKSKPDYTLFFANRIYRPSYISLHTALAFYGIIPEAIVQITSVTSLKTVSFQNEFGEYNYKSIRNELMFGYDIKTIANGQSLHLARPEKAILDLLYLYPFYDTELEMENLRLDEDFLFDELNLQRLENYLEKFKSKALVKRVNLFKSTYGL
jgi:predicted transcriptional regulator of viral defense system